MYPSAFEFSEARIKASYDVLIEVMHILADFVDDMSVVGGWVPTLLIPSAIEPHIRSLDVDLLLNGQKISEAGYATIGKIFRDHGYRQEKKIEPKLKYLREVVIDGKTYRVPVDFLTGETERDYAGKAGKNWRTVRGSDLVFARSEIVALTGTLPGRSGSHSVKCRIMGVVPLIVFKGIVMGKRMKPKDAYDLDFVLRNYPGSLAAIGKLIARDIQHELVAEGLSIIEQKFATIDAWGPKAVAEFLCVDNEKEQLELQRRVLETVQELLDRTLRL
jgi:hypothetical protein